MIEVFARRVMQIRRMACKSEGAADRYKDMIKRYADNHAKGQEWPRWYQQTCKEDNTTEGRPSSFPIEQPHPSTNQHQTDWRKDIEPYGPVGLLVESIIWHGMVIDQHMRIWQQNEEPIDILQMPYQSLKVSVQAAAARARTKAEWMRNSSKRIATAEIDRSASQIDNKLTEEQQGIMRTIAMGGDQALQEIANYNEDVDPVCTHCGKGGVHCRSHQVGMRAAGTPQATGRPYHRGYTEESAPDEHTIRNCTGYEVGLLCYLLGKETRRERHKRKSQEALRGQHVASQSREGRRFYPDEEASVGAHRSTEEERKKCQTDYVDAQRRTRNRADANVPKS